MLATSIVASTRAPSENISFSIVVFLEIIFEKKIPHVRLYQSLSIKNSQIWVKHVNMVKSDVDILFVLE